VARIERHHKATHPFDDEGIMLAGRLHAFTHEFTEINLAALAARGHVGRECGAEAPARDEARILETHVLAHRGEKGRRITFCKCFRVNTAY
jgi:hypothetical protein